MTLVEVLVALAIVGMAVSVLAAGYINVLNGYRSIEDTSGASPDVAFARHQVMIAPTREKAEEAGDATRINGEPLSWRAVLQETDLPDVFRVELTVELGMPPPEEMITVVHQFWLRQPAWSLPDEAGPRREDFRKRIEDGRKLQ
jgi:type II secretion system protein I